MHISFGVDTLENPIGVQPNDHLPTTCQQRPALACARCRDGAALGAICVRLELDRSCWRGDRSRSRCPRAHDQPKDAPQQFERHECGDSAAFSANLGRSLSVASMGSATRRLVYVCRIRNWLGDRHRGCMRPRRLDGCVADDAACLLNFQAELGGIASVSCLFITSSSTTP